MILLVEFLYVCKYLKKLLNEPQNIIVDNK